MTVSNISLLEEIHMKMLTSMYLVMPDRERTKHKTNEEVITYNNNASADIIAFRINISVLTPPTLSLSLSKKRRKKS